MRPLNMFAIASAPCALILVLLFNWWFGFTKDNAINITKMGDDISDVQVFEEISLNDGTIYKVTCKGGGIESDQIEENGHRYFNCMIHLKYIDQPEGEFLASFSFMEELIDHTLTYYMKAKVLPRLHDLNPQGKLEMEASLTEGEKQQAVYVEIAKIDSALLGFGVNVEFSMEKNSLEGLVLSELRKAAHMLNITIDRRELDRIGSELVYQVDQNLNLFQLRKETWLLVFSGTFEFIILWVAGYSILLTVLILVFGFRSSNDLSHIENLSLVGAKAGQLGEILTYLGLLGTLVGIFFTVVDLSGVDFVDELRKVFDQTTSFGSMSLAIATSVLGVSAAILVWLFQTAVTFILGKDYFTSVK